MSRAIQKEQRDNVRITKTADALILTNERTGESESAPLNASAWQRREIIKRLQPQHDSTYDQPLVPKTAANRETPLPVPITRGALARKREEENREHAAKIQAQRDRETQIRDRHALATEIIEGLKSSPAEPAPVDLGDEYRRWLETTLALTKLRADASATPDAIAAAEFANREAWGLPAQEGGNAE